MLQDTTSLEISGITQVQNLTNLNLTGSGVLIGFIDTGIDYTNRVFRDAAGNTRIEAIWDQSLQGGATPGISHTARNIAGKRSIRPFRLIILLMSCPPLTQMDMAHFWQVSRRVLHFRRKTLSVQRPNP